MTDADNDQFPSGFARSTIAEGETDIGFIVPPHWIALTRGRLSWVLDPTVEMGWRLTWGYSDDQNDVDSELMLMDQQMDDFVQLYESMRHLT